MSIATQINKFISNHAKVLLKEIKDMKIDRRKKKKKNAKTDDNFTGQFDNVRSESAKVV